MDFRDLKAFVHVAQQESFSRAATQLRIAQSALSRRVERLEHQLGAKLLARHGRGVRLTEGGQVLLERAEALIRELETVEADVQCLAKEPTGHVRLALPPFTSEVMTPLVVAACRAAFPRLSLHIREGFSGNIHRWVMADEVDIAVFYSPEISPDLDITPLLDEPLDVVLAADSPVGVGQKAINAAELAGLPLILPSRPHSLRLVVERYAAEHGFHPQVVYEIDGIRTTKAMVKAGLGSTIFSHSETSEGIASGMLRALPLSPPLSWRLSMVTRRAARPSRAVTEIKRLIRSQVPILLERGLWCGRMLIDPEAPQR